ncbi:MAG: hypothetical protein US69_C0005G0012 [candidate division TM6 bacterium GW2011_GWF2_38_10]|nr:MAG: hypothetical protein US69_C0005G0012 [candidate division TM6 bacterium GW2011_GWF2_38_10]
MIIHKELDLNHWFTFSLFEQLANIGCDIERSIRWKKKGKPNESKMAFDRALELLDATIADPKNKGPRLKELLRVREVLKDYFIYNNEYNWTDEAWQKYFYDFNYAIALQRGR